ncbi:hypothetical protein [Psychrobacter sp. I-STPA6b]|uniref:hypothetical protein n=1 Tax=Psychrobacter sp. I-STPA6b TaxID=2585718 RepID=UPI001D0CD266|nr:hypothetical protein [Psychrobacter sp. I-STPA6b]
MSKEFLNIDEFIAELESKNYHWNDPKTTNLLLELFDSKRLTPVIFYNGNFDVIYENPGFMYDEVRIAKIDHCCNLKGYFYFSSEDIVDFYLYAIETEDNIDNLWLTDYMQVEIYRTYGTKPPVINKYMREYEGIYNYLLRFPENNTWEISFNELLFPTHQVTEIFKSQKPSDEQLTIDNLMESLEIAKTTIAQQQAQIADLKQLEQAQSSQPNKLDIIFDDTFEHHAPDLKHAINLWLDLYANGEIKEDSHTNKANQWIKKNTNYDDNAISSTNRIREISTPLKDFGAKRSKENDK